MLHVGARSWAPRGAIDVAALPGVRRAPEHPTPPWPRPLIAASPPAGARWLHEIHRSGLLVRARVSASGEVVLGARASKLPALPLLEGALRTLAGGDALFEGYLVAHGSQSLDDAVRHASRELVFYANDLLYTRGGYDLTGVALQRRKRVLRQLFSASPRSSRCVAFGDHVRGAATAFWRRACAMDFDGILSKSSDSPYDPLRYQWIWVPPSTTRQQPDSLVRSCA